MPNLAETQNLFWQLIRAPEGVAAGLAALPDRARRLPGGIDAWIRGDERLSAVERLDVYANMYFFRLLDVLAEDFPALRARVGHPSFHALAVEYLDAHPSESPSVRRLGHALGAFLETHPSSREWPYLADLARFEWALLEAFDALNAEPLGANRLKDVPPEDWASARIVLTPSLRVLPCTAPVQEVWSAAIEARDLPRIANEATTIRVWREELAVFHRTIDAAEKAALGAIGRGECFAGACEAAAEIIGEEKAAQEVLAMLGRWLGDRMVVGFETA